MPRAQSQLLLPRLACSRTEPRLKSVHLLSSLAHVKIQPEAPPARRERESRKKRGGWWVGREEESENLPTTARKHGSEPTPLNRRPNSAQLHATPPAAKLWSTALPFTRRGPAPSPGGKKKHNPFQSGSKTDMKARDRL